MLSGTRYQVKSEQLFGKVTYIYIYIYIMGIYNNVLVNVYFRERNTQDVKIFCAWVYSSYFLLQEYENHGTPEERSVCFSAFPFFNSFAVFPSTEQNKEETTFFLLTNIADVPGDLGRVHALPCWLFLPIWEMSIYFYSISGQVCERSKPVAK